MVRAAVEGVETVIHLAALPSVHRSVADPLVSNDVNAGGTLNLLVAARDAGVRRVVYAASSSAYGDTEVLPKVETMPAAPRSPYAVNKHVGELYCRVFTEVYGLETVSLRYFNLYGRSQFIVIRDRSGAEHPVIDCPGSGPGRHSVGTRHQQRFH